MLFYFFNTIFVTTHFVGAYINSKIILNNLFNIFIKNTNKYVKIAKIINKKLNNYYSFKTKNNNYVNDKIKNVDK